jgi:hypothetical protein
MSRLSLITLMAMASLSLVKLSKLSLEPICASDREIDGAAMEAGCGAALCGVFRTSCIDRPPLVNGEQRAVCSHDRHPRQITALACGRKSTLDQFLDQNLIDLRTISDPA